MFLFLLLLELSCFQDLHPSSACTHHTWWSQTSCMKSSREKQTTTQIPLASIPCIRSKVFISIIKSLSNKLCLKVFDLVFLKYIIKIINWLILGQKRKNRIICQSRQIWELKCKTLNSWKGKKSWGCIIKFGQLNRLDVLRLFRGHVGRVWDNISSLC